MSGIDQAVLPVPSKRRLPSPTWLFVISGLVILTAVCGLIGIRMHRQQAKLEFMRQVGADVEFEPASPVWLHAIVQGTFGEEHAAGLTIITKVDLRGTGITDVDLQELSDLTELKELWVPGTADLHLMAFLNRFNVSVADSLAEIKCRLDAPVTDAGLRHLSGLVNLEILCLFGTHVTDAGLPYLRRLTKLETLYLNNTKITDAGLHQLSGLTNLKTLYLDNTQVTDVGVAELQSQLPDVEIYR